MDRNISRERIRQTQTTISESLFGRRWFWAGMAVLMCFLSLFCSNARAGYAIDASGGSDVYGIYDSNSSVTLFGINFGHVTATATDGNAYGIFHDNHSFTASLLILGQLPSTGLISSETESGDNAYGLYSDSSIYFSSNINGTITATAYGSEAYALGSYWSMVIEGDIGSDANIAATAANGSNAYGLYSLEGAIETGNIIGGITASTRSISSSSAGRG